MKYGVLFSTVSALLIATALTRGGWFIFYIWPAVSFAVVASGYFYLGPRVYGKSLDGVISKVNLVILLPYLIYLWSVWHALRLFKRESAFDQLNDKIYIGRRLLGNEFPSHIDHVIDLTCEFSEPMQLRSTNYHSFQVLDGFVPTLSELESWVSEVAKLPGNIYIHCAEGHGRTGMFAAALLVKIGQFETTEDALSFVYSKRRLVRLGRRQRDLLASMQPA